MPINKQEGAEKLKELSEDGGWEKLGKNLSGSPFNKDLTMKLFPARRFFMNSFRQLDLLCHLFIVSTVVLLLYSSKKIIEKVSIV